MGKSRLCVHDCFASRHKVCNTQMFEYHQPQFDRQVLWKALCHVEFVSTQLRQCCNRPCCTSARCAAPQLRQVQSPRVSATSTSVPWRNHRKNRISITEVHLLAPQKKPASTVYRDKNIRNRTYKRKKQHLPHSPLHQRGSFLGPAVLC